MVLMVKSWLNVSRRGRRGLFVQGFSFSGILRAPTDLLDQEILLFGVSMDGLTTTIGLLNLQDNFKARRFHGKYRKKRCFLSGSTLLPAVSWQSHYIKP